MTHKALAKVRNLLFVRLRVNGLRLKLFSFSVRGELVEPQKNTFARGSIVTRFPTMFFNKRISMRIRPRGLALIRWYYKIG
jgi:hypothetical protein